MGTLSRSAKQGFIFLDTLIALVVLAIGLSGLLAGALALSRVVYRERELLIEAVKTANEAGTVWFDAP